MQNRGGGLSLIFIAALVALPALAAPTAVKPTVVTLMFDDGRAGMVPTPDAMKLLGDAEYAHAIRPGDPTAGAPFWNAHAVQFMYAPSFAFKGVGDAVKYRYSVTDDVHKVFRFEGATPWCTLAPVWKDLVTGQASVIVEGLDAEGRAIGFAGERAFWKAAPFKGFYAPAARPYAEAARMCAAYMAETPAVKGVLETGRPDPGYELNCYPTKMHAANVKAMLCQAKLDPAKRGRVLALARAEADYLLTVMEPADAALPYFTLTYTKTPPKDEKGTVAGLYCGQSMNIYPAEAAHAFLDLFAETKDAKYFEAAKKIASTYLKEQLPCGTWYVKQYLKDGKPVAENLMIPTVAMTLFDRLEKLTGDKVYRTASDRAWTWIEANPLTTWYWEGHFEDTRLLPRYENMTKHTAIEVMLYLLGRKPGDPEAVRLAREILRFSEDQFVLWENCKRPGIDGYNPEFKWLPGVAEQYECFHVFDASAAKLIFAYLALYRAEGTVVDLMKAKALADTMTRIQRPNGCIPTGWTPSGVERESYWINCMGFALSSLVEIAAYQEECDRLSAVRPAEPIAPSAIRVTVGGKEVKSVWKGDRVMFSEMLPVGQEYEADVELVFTVPEAATYRVTFDADWRLWVNYGGCEIFALPDGFRSPKCDHEQYVDLKKGENVFKCRFGAGSMGAWLQCRLRPIFVPLSAASDDGQAQAVRHSRSRSRIRKGS